MSVYEQRFAEVVWNMEPEEFVELVKAYDAYIANANEEDLYVSGWRPVTLMEFYDNEWQSR
jgi:hypothetical protein